MIALYDIDHTEKEGNILASMHFWGIANKSMTSSASYWYVLAGLQAQPRARQGRAGGHTSLNLLGFCEGIGRISGSC